MDLFKIFGTIAIDNSEANSALNNTADQAENADGKLSTMIGTAAKWATAIAGAAIAAGGAVYGFAQKVANTTDTIDKMSQKIGISREAYQELDFICSQSGTSVDTLQAGMKTLTAAMDGAASGTASNVEQFERLGIAVTDADGNLRSQEDVMWETLAALQSMENQTEKARLATELFGRSGTELMPLLNGASGSIDEMRQMASDLGLVIDNETIDAGVRLTDTMDQAKRAFSAVAVNVGAKLLPVVQKAFEWILEKLPAITEQIELAVEWVQTAIEWCKQHETVLTIIAIAVGTLTAAIIAYNIAQNALAIATAIATAATKAFGAVMAFVTSPITLIILAIGALIAIVVLLVKHWDEIKQKAAEIANAASEKFEEMKGKIQEKVASIVANVTSKFEEIKSNIKSKLNTAKSTVENIFNSIKNGISDKINAAKDAVKGAIDKIKGFLDFEFKLPHLPLPHFSISPAGWVLGDLLKGSIPSLGIEWYAKGGILTDPTVFGINGNKAMVGGEAGDEAVAPIDVLRGYVREEVSAVMASHNAGIGIALEKILEAIVRMDDNMGGNLREALDGTSLTINSREFGRMVRQVI